MQDLSSVLDMESIREQFKQSDSIIQQKIEADTARLRNRIEFYRTHDYETIKKNIEQNFRMDRARRGIKTIVFSKEEQKQLSEILERTKKEDKFFDSLSPEKVEVYIGLEKQRAFDSLSHKQRQMIVSNALSNLPNAQLGEYYNKKIMTGYKSVDEASLGEKSFAKRVRVNIAKSKASLKTINAAKVGKMSVKILSSVAGIALSGATGFMTGGIPGAVTRMAITTASIVAIKGVKSVIKMIKTPKNIEEIEYLKQVGLYECLERQVESQEEMRKFLKENHAEGLAL